MKIIFKRPEVAAKYEATVEEDITLHTGCYTGKLSGINICGADHLFSTKHPAIILRHFDKLSVNSAQDDKASKSAVAKD